MQRMSIVLEQIMLNEELDTIRVTRVYTYKRYKNHRYREYEIIDTNRGGSDGPATPAMHGQTTFGPCKCKKLLSGFLVKIITFYRVRYIVIILLSYIERESSLDLAFY